MRIYLTHCSAKKAASLKHTGEEVTPDKLYTSTHIQRFMNECKNKGVQWAILSDKYGVWFPKKKHKWYDKHPNTVSTQEFKALVKDFEEKLHDFDEIFFYHNPGRFHALYKRLLKTVKIRGKIILLTHKDRIA